MKTKNISSGVGQFINSIWFFPAIMTLLLITLTALQISGSSVGIYQGYFYGQQKDTHLIANQPESIRSDEFLVVTQMTLAQSKAGYPLVNKNFGNGENMSLQDVPYKEWSQIFKPHNLAFFILPVEYAFAFKWWLMAYLLVISCYFFILAILPGKKLFAIAVSLSLLFSAFIQWWYQYITLATLYYSFFLATAFIYFLRQKEIFKKVLLSLLIIYLLVSFALILYPPFQIACALALSGFLIGHLISHYKKSGRKIFLNNLAWLAGCLFISLIVVGIFVSTRRDVINGITNTVYPGQRIVRSGGFSTAHLLSGNLGYEFNSPTKATAYKLFNAPTNQSEASNFILLTPFLLLPSAWLLLKDKRAKRETDWALLGATLVFLLFMLELFVSAFTPLSKLFFFEKIPLQRELIGLGLLNIIQLVLLVRNMSVNKKNVFSGYLWQLYVRAVFIVELLLGVYAHHKFPGFIRWREVLLFSLPIPVILYFLFTRRFRVGALALLAFSVFVAAPINPLYKSLDIVKDNPLDVAVQDIVKKDPNSRWVAEGLLLENFPALNGAKSLSGVYYYPQPALWKNVAGKNGSNIYNRYAHVTFEFPDNVDPANTQLKLLGIDHFEVDTNVCSNFLRHNNVKYVLTPGTITSPCAKLQKEVKLPTQSFKIYSL